MKKVFALVALLVLAAACAGPSTNREAASNANMSPEAKAPARMADDEAAAREKATWDAIKKKDYDALGNMLANDYIEVENDAVYDKAGALAFFKGFNLSDVTFSDWKTLPVDKDAVIVMYNVTVKATSKGEAVPPGPYRAASAWVNRDGKWLDIYYQETLVNTAAPPPPPPPAKASPAAKTGASPATKTAAAATGAEPAANEKMVWEALKANDSDAFAAFLAADFIEVEQDAVSDKAGSVKSVSQIDLSKASQSEWKTVKFDDGASLVTYMLKLPGAKPDQERHTTIWVNRSGKWLALFHQGTPVAPPAATKAATPAAAASPKVKMKM
jgi:hypothetical protein